MGKILTSLKNIIDLRISLLGALFMGLIVFGINLSETAQWAGSSTAALKQGTLTLVMGGFFMRGCELLATRIKKQYLALLSAVMIPSIIAVLLTFAVHSMKGTPKPLESTLVTFVLIIPSTAVWGFLKRRSYRSVQKIS
ncbi:MAG: hypothetical protein R6T99_09925 [Bacteroidales bacterium]